MKMPIPPFFLSLFASLLVLSTNVGVASNEEYSKIPALAPAPPQQPLTKTPPAHPPRPNAPMLTPPPPYKPPTPPTATPPTPPTKPPTAPTIPVKPPASPYTPPHRPPLSPVKPPTSPVKPPPPLVKPPTYPVKSPPPPVKPPTYPVRPPTPAPYTPPPVRTRIDCVPLCGKRCSLHSRKKICMRACLTCCSRCKCVPPGTYGNKEKCGTCYTNMRTRGNRFKCP